MKDYASMSDIEIDMMVSKICSPEFHRNYCNNPADAWPIITGSMISICPVGNDGQLWEASGMGGMKADYDKNPLRAAMIVFMMMKESEK